MASHNTNVYGYGGPPVGSGQLFQKLEAVGAQSRQLELRLDRGGNSSLLTTVGKGNPENSGMFQMGTTALPSYKHTSRGMARIKPRGLRASLASAAFPESNPALSRISSSESSRVFTPDVYSGSLVKKLQIRPDAHKLSQKNRESSYDTPGALNLNRSASDFIDSPLRKSVYMSSSTPVLRHTTSETTPPSMRQGRVLDLPAPPASDNIYPNRPHSSPERTSENKESDGLQVQEPVRPKPIRKPGLFTPSNAFDSKSNPDEGTLAPQGRHLELDNNQEDEEATGCPISIPYCSYSEFYVNEVSKRIDPPEASPEAPDGCSSCPNLTKEGYFTDPPYDLMQQMTESELQAVCGLTVGRVGFGKIHWDGMMDVRNMDFDFLIEIEEKQVGVYEKVPPEERPDVGNGLNRPATITLCDVFVPKDADPVKFKEKVKKRTQKMGAEFVDYNECSGIWQFRVKHFSRYGLDLDDSDEDSEEVQAVPKIPEPPIAAPQVPVKPNKTGALNLTIKQKPLPLHRDVDPDQVNLGEHEDLKSEVKPTPGLRSALEHETRQELFSEGPHRVREDIDEVNPGTHGGLKPEVKSTPVGLRSALKHETRQELFSQGPRRVREDIDEEKNSTILNTSDSEMNEGNDVKVMRLNPVQDVSFQSTPGNFQQAGSSLLFSPNHLQNHSFYSTFGRPEENTPVKAMDIVPVPPGEAHSSKKCRINRPKIELRAFYPINESKTFSIFQEAVKEVQEHYGHRIPLPKSSKDFGQFMGRSFRVGWGPNGEIIHPGRPAFLTSASVSKQFGIKHFLLVEKVNPMPSTFKTFDTNGNPVKTSPEDIHTHFVPLLEQHFQGSSSKMKSEIAKHKVATWFRVPSVVPFSKAPSKDNKVEYERWVACVHAFLKTSTDQSDGFGQGRVVSQAFALVNALFGQEISARIAEQHVEWLPVKPLGSEDPQQLRRKEMIGHWLKEAVASNVLPRSSSPEELYQSIFELLSRCQISKAAAVAREANHHRLSMILAQASDPIMRYMILDQVNQWGESAAIKHISPKLCLVYALVSGRISQQFAQLPLGLDWLRHFGLYLWYQNGPDDTIGKALEDYNNDWSVAENQVPAPQPWYAEQGDVDADQCILHRLLSLYASCARGQLFFLEDAVDPRGLTPDVLDYHYSWHFLTLLRALNVCDEKYDTLWKVTDAVVFQLLSVGLWQWAIYCLLHLEDEQSRTYQVKEVINRYCHGGTEFSKDYQERCNFVIQEFHVPEEWFASSRAQYLTGCCWNDPRKSAQFLIQAKRWVEAHNLICVRLMPRAILESLGKKEGPAFDPQLCDWLQQLQHPMHEDPEKSWEKPGGAATYLKFYRLFNFRSNLLSVAATEKVALGVINEISATIPLLAEDLKKWECPAFSLDAPVPKEDLHLERACKAKMGSIVFEMEALLAEAFAPEDQPLLYQKMSERSFEKWGLLSECRVKQLGLIRNEFIQSAARSLWVKRSHTQMT